MPHFECPKEDFCQVEGAGHPPVKEMIDKSPTVPRGTVFVGFCECGHEWVAVLGPSAVWCLWVSGDVVHDA